MDSIFSNKQTQFEYSIFNELFLLLGQACFTKIHNYKSHLFWHGIDLCSELFRRRVYPDRLQYRQSRGVLLGWLVCVIDKLLFFNFDYVTGLCDARCYDTDDTSLDRDLFDDTSIGPQFPPPPRLRLKHKRSSSSTYKNSIISCKGRHDKYEKRQSSEGEKISDNDEIVTERRSMSPYEKEKSSDDKDTIVDDRSLTRENGRLRNDEETDDDDDDNNDSNDVRYLSKYEKIEKKPHGQGKLSDMDVCLVERPKRFDMFKEMRYIKLFLKMLLNNSRYSQFRPAIIPCIDILQRRYDREMPFSRTDRCVEKRIIDATGAVTVLTNCFLDDKK